MSGNKYMLSEVMEPQLFVIRKQKKDSPEKVAPVMTYYMLDGSVYQALQRFGRENSYPSPTTASFAQKAMLHQHLKERRPLKTSNAQKCSSQQLILFLTKAHQWMKFLSENQQLSHSLILSVCLPLPCHQPTEFAPSAVKIVSEALEASI